VLVAAYEFLLAAPPINRWRMPAADDVVFQVRGSTQWLGRCTQGVGGCAPVIELSAVLVGSTPMLLAVMAHEMVHVYQFERGTWKGDHNAQFRRLAKSVAEVHGFDTHWIAR